MVIRPIRRLSIEENHYLGIERAPRVRIHSQERWSDYQKLNSTIQNKDYWYPVCIPSKARRYWFTDILYVIGLETVVYEEDPDIYESRTPIYEGQPLMIGCRTKNKKDLKMKWIWSRGDGGNQTISQGNEPPGM